MLPAGVPLPPTLGGLKAPPPPPPPPSLGGSQAPTPPSQPQTPGVAARRPKTLDLQSELQMQLKNRSNNNSNPSTAVGGNHGNALPWPPATGQDFQSELSLRLSKQVTPDTPSDIGHSPQSSTGDTCPTPPAITAKATSAVPPPPTLPKPQQSPNSPEAPAVPSLPPQFPASQQLHEEAVKRESLSHPPSAPQLDSATPPRQRCSSDQEDSPAIAPSVSIMQLRRQSMWRASMRRDKLQQQLVLTSNPLLDAPEKPPHPITLHPYNPDTHIGYADTPWALRLRKEYFSPIDKLSSGRELALVYQQVGVACCEWAGRLVGRVRHRHTGGPVGTSGPPVPLLGHSRYILRHVPSAV